MAEIEVLGLLVLNLLVLGVVAFLVARRAPAGDNPRVEAEMRTVREKVDAVNTSTAVLQERTGALPRVEAALKSLEIGVGALPAMASKVDEIHATFTDTTVKGKIGEAAVEAVLSRLPTDLWERQYPLGGGTVDFIVRMPNGLMLPIDAKMSGSELVGDLVAAIGRSNSENGAGAEEARLVARDLARDIGARLYSQAEKIRKYTKEATGVLPVVLEAVPGPVFDSVGHSVKSDCSKIGVEVVSYDMLLPLISVLRSQNTHDVESIQRATASVERVRRSFEKIDEILVNKVGKARTMLANAQAEIEAELTNARSALAGMDP
ncbi:MAG: DNA recombination protein RmuC [Euryarchaeota archaeon]|nr:DNA recombination protein RmuC [Euryarchaeota archaeon]